MKIITIILWLYSTFCLAQTPVAFVPIGHSGGSAATRYIFPEFASQGLDSDYWRNAISPILNLGCDVWYHNPHGHDPIADGDMRFDQFELAAKISGLTKITDKVAIKNHARWIKDRGRKSYWYIGSVHHTPKLGDVPLQYIDEWATRQYSHFLGSGQTICFDAAAWENVPKITNQAQYSLCQKLTRMNRRPVVEASNGDPKFHEWNQCAEYNNVISWHFTQGKPIPINVEFYVLFDASYNNKVNEIKTGWTKLKEEKPQTKWIPLIYWLTLKNNPDLVLWFK